MTNPEAQEKIDQLAADFFAIFDNRGGRLPDFSKLEGMFIPEAVIVKCSDGRQETMSVRSFIAPRELMFRNGSLREFHEWETESQTFISGSIATRLCEYQKRGLLDDEAPSGEVPSGEVPSGETLSGGGSKSIQLLRTPSGWKIVSILWQDLPG